MHDVGVDLAWGNRARTGLAALDEDGHLLDVTTIRTDAEIFDWARRWANGPCLAAIDAPIIVRNPTGARRCERLVGKYFGRYHASCHSSNTAKPAFAPQTRALRLAQALDLEVDPASTASRRAIEVYPHPAIVMLFGLESVLQYKDKRGRTLDHRRAEAARLLTSLEDLAHRDVALHLTSNAQWREIRRIINEATTKAALRNVEDGIDAVVCAYIARYSRLRPDAVRRLGSHEDGYIVTPVTPELAARIDQCRPRSAAGGRRGQAEWLWVRVHRAGP
jgi:predicted RNase H-like nuclease